MSLSHVSVQGRFDTAILQRVNGADGGKADGFSAVEKS